MATDVQASDFRGFSERVGRQFVTGVEDFGYGALLQADLTATPSRKP